MEIGFSVKGKKKSTTRFARFWHIGPKFAEFKFSPESEKLFQVITEYISEVIY